MCSPQNGFLMFKMNTIETVSLDQLRHPILVTKIRYSDDRYLPAFNSVPLTSSAGWQSNGSGDKESRVQLGVI